MSDNTRRVEESLRAMERGDVDAVARNAHPDIEFVNSPNALEPGTRHATFVNVPRELSCPTALLQPQVRTVAGNW